MKIDIGFNIVAAVWVAVVTLIFTPVYVHYLGLEAYGLIGLLATLQVSLGVLDLGLSQVLARELARYTGGGLSRQSVLNLIRSVEMVAFFIAAAIAIVMWISSGWIGRSWLQVGNNPATDLIHAIAIMGIVIALRLVEGLYRGAVMGLHRQVQLNVITLTAVTLRACGAFLILVFVTRSIAAFFAWQSLISALTIISLRWLMHASLDDGRARGGFSTLELKRISRFALGVTSITLLGVALTQVDKLLLSRLLLLKDYGEYILAVTLAAAPLSLAGPITQAAQPRFARAVAAQDELTLAHLFHGSAQFLSVIVGSAAVVIMCFSHEVLVLWLHNPALANRLAPLVRVLALGSLLNGLVWLPYGLQLAYGWTKLGARINLIAVATLIPSLLIVVPKYGAIGAAWLWVVLNIGYCTVSLHFMFLRILPEHKIRWYVFDAGMPLLAAAVVALALKGAFPGDGSFLLRLLFLGLVSVTAVCVAAAAASVIRREALAFGLMLLRLRRQSVG